MPEPMPEPMPEIVHARLPLVPWMADHTLRLPGTVPIDPADWLQRDEVFAAQMAERDRLIADHPAEVLAMAGSARPAAEELLALILCPPRPRAGLRPRRAGDAAAPTACSCRSAARRSSPPDDWSRRTW